MTAFAELTDEEARQVLRGEMCRRSYAEFVKAAWPILFRDEPLQWSWHMQAICDHLQALIEGRIINNRLAIAVPPSTSKSVLASVFLPAWVWGVSPWKKFLYASASANVVSRDAEASRQLAKSDEYRDLLGIDWTLSKTQDAKLYYENSRGGARISRTVGQKTIGVKAHIGGIDDPLDPMDAFSDKAALVDHVTWHSRVFVGRMISWESPIFLVMQRVHDMDLIGMCLRQGGYEYLMLPAEFDPERRCVTSIFADPRTHRGELLDPVRMPRQYLQQRRLDLGTQAYLAQYQQDPAPAGGTAFKLDWLERAYYKPSEVPDANSDFWDYTFSSWDFTFTKSRDSDFVAGGAFGVKGIDIYLLRHTRKKMSYVECLQLMKQEQALYPKMRARLIEKGANGPKIIRETQRSVRAVIPIGVQGESKESRAAACSPMVEAGQYHIPDPAVVDWVREEYLPELLAFPHGSHDDQVDMTTQALNWVRECGDKRKTFSLHLSGR